MELMKVEKHIISPQSGLPSITLVQDCMTAMYLLTLPETRILRNDAMQFYFATKQPQNPFPLMVSRDATMSGVDLFCLCLLGPRISRIIDRRRSFPLDKKRTASLVHDIYTVVGDTAVVHFLSDAQRLGAAYLRLRGFSTGYLHTKDNLASPLCRVAPEELRIDSSGDKSELEIMQQLELVASARGKDAMEQMRPGNAIKIMHDSGAKGKPANTMQLSACVGQQIAGGRRAGLVGKSKRALPHFTVQETAERAESRGFVASNFREGLNPQEYFFTAQGSREGMIDTSLMTADTGALSRRLMKAMENLRVEYDNTVRDTSGNVYQFTYGADGYDPIKLWPPVEVDGFATQQRLAIDVAKLFKLEGRETYSLDGIDELLSSGALPANLVAHVRQVLSA
jgi:DNA-directed RNA polymerase beta' subunit